MILLHMQILRYFNKICDNKAKYVINRLIHGLLHIALVISPRLKSRSRADNKGNMKKTMY
jgi:hypothetical protein